MTAPADVWEEGVIFIGASVAGLDVRLKWKTPDGQGATLTAPPDALTITSGEGDGLTVRRDVPASEDRPAFSFAVLGHAASDVRAALYEAKEAAHLFRLPRLTAAHVMPGGVTFEGRTTQGQPVRVEVARPLHTQPLVFVDEDHPAGGAFSLSVYAGPSPVPGAVGTLPAHVCTFAVYPYTSEGLAALEALGWADRLPRQGSEGGNA